jgi:hypothetical protein
VVVVVVAVVVAAAAAVVLHICNRLDKYGKKEKQPMRA